MLNTEGNRFFSKKSNLDLYREANWDPDRLAESEIAPVSMLGSLRLARMKARVDPETGEKHLVETDLLKRARAEGIDDSKVMWMSSNLSEIVATATKDQLSPQQLAAVVPDGYRRAPASELNRAASAANRPNMSDRYTSYGISGRSLLDFVKLGICRDVGSSAPLSSLNQLWVTVWFFMLFMQIESELKHVRNPLWIRAYETEGWSRGNRVALTIYALEEDEECLRIMARGLKNPRAGFLNHVY